MVDANILIAAVIRPVGWTASEVERLRQRLVVPEAFWRELERHLPARALASGRDGQAWMARVEAWKGRLRTVSARDLDRLAQDPLVRRAEAMDPGDASYLACLVATGATNLWTRDKGLLREFPGIAVPIVED